MRVKKVEVLVRVIVDKDEAHDEMTAVARMSAELEDDGDYVYKAVHEVLAMVGADVPLTGDFAIGTRFEVAHDASCCLGRTQ